jgi:hypothetical protein
MQDRSDILLKHILDEFSKLIKSLYAPRINSQKIIKHVKVL